MARTINEIFQLIQSEKNNMTYINDKLKNPDGNTTIYTEQDLLTSLQSNNKVGIWLLWAFIIAVSENLLEQNWDEFQVELEDIKNRAVVGSRLWWRDKCLEWQYGDILEIDPLNYGVKYAVIDETKQLIKHAGISEINGKVVLKVQKDYGTGLLTSSELNSFESYVDKVRFAGIRTDIWNFNPDNLKLFYTIYYDPLIGEATVKNDVETTITDYIHNLPFDSTFNKTDLTDKLQQINGVLDPVFVDGYGKPEGTSTYIQFDNYYESVSGYCDIDNTFPLDATITYTPKIN